MHLSEPFTGMFPPRKMTDAELATAIRIDIMAELDAVALYQAHYLATDNEDARRILAHVMEEEKEHAAEFLELLKALDPVQAAHIAEAPIDVTEILGHPLPARPTSATSEAERATAETNEPPTGISQPSTPSLTVGSLFQAP